MRSSIDPAALLSLALALLVLPLRWLLAWALAAGVHELCHWLAVSACGGEVRWLALGPGGAEMAVSGLSRGKELLCALAGPMGALLVLPLARWMPAVAVCAVFQSACNLLPLYPLDGGRALRCGMLMLFPEKAALGICGAVAIFCLAMIWLGALYAVFVLKLGLMPLVLALMLQMKTKFTEEQP